MGIFILLMEMSSMILASHQNGTISVVKILVWIWIGPSTRSGHKLKTGFEHTITDIQVLDIDEP